MAPLRTKFNDTFTKLKDRFDRERHGESASSGSGSSTAAQPRSLPSGSGSALTTFPSSNSSGSAMAQMLSGKPSGSPAVLDQAYPSLKLPSMHVRSPSQDSTISLEYTSAPIKAVMAAHGEIGGITNGDGNLKRALEPEPGHKHWRSNLPPGSRLNPIDLDARAFPASGSSNAGFDKQKAPSFGMPLSKPALASSEFSQLLPSLDKIKREALDNDGPAARVEGNAKAVQMLRDEKMALALHAEFSREAQAGSSYGVPLSFGKDFNVGPRCATMERVDRPMGSRPPRLFPHAEPLRLACAAARSDALQDYGKSVLGLSCKACKKPFVTDGEDIVSTIKAVLAKKDWLQPVLECKKCKKVSFVGCTHLSEGKVGQGQTYFHSNFDSPSPRLAWCCPEGRIFLLWALCCGPEYVKLSESSPSGRSSSSLSTRTSVRSRLGRTKSQSHEKSTTSTGPSKRLSRPSGVSNGTGYGGAEDYYPFMALATVSGLAVSGAGSSLSGPGSSLKRRHPQPQRSPGQDQKEMDFLWEQYFRSVASLLPSLDRGGNHFDHEPPSLLRPMLERSPLVIKASELMRNDSAIEMAARDTLYEALLDFVEALGGHPATAALIYDDFLRYPLEDQLVHASLDNSPAASSSRIFGDGGALRSRQKSSGKGPEKGQSLASLVASLALQCGKIHRTATSLSSDTFDSEEDKRLLVLCSRVVRLGEHHRANGAIKRVEKDPDAMDCDEEGAIPMAGSSANPRFTVAVTTRAQTQTRAQAQAQAAQKAQAEKVAWHKAHCVGEVLDEKLLEDFHYARDAKALGEQKSAIRPGRMKKLISEVAMLASSLPEGIFVRHGASRIDVMKVLIVGPTGTPYEGGLFEFDLFCPDSYPQTPPWMNFRTTGMGRARFNPNLYEDGKVCLSLLGTWSGEPWRPNESTILQILVSIQAMIFTAEPWYNEPGRERLNHKSASESYNSTVQQHTVQHAMLHWLDDRLASDRTRSGESSGQSSKRNSTEGSQDQDQDQDGDDETMSGGPKANKGANGKAPKLPYKTMHPSVLPSSVKPPPSLFGPGLGLDGGPPVAAAAQHLMHPPAPLGASPLLKPKQATFGEGLSQQPKPPATPLSHYSSWTQAAELAAHWEASQVHQSVADDNNNEGEEEEENDDDDNDDGAGAGGQDVMDIDETGIVWSEEMLPTFPNMPLLSPIPPHPPRLAALKRKLQGPQPDDYVWGEVIRQHFTFHAQAILETTKKWKLNKRALRTRQTTAGALTQELEAALKREKFL